VASPQPGPVAAQLAPKKIDVQPPAREQFKKRLEDALAGVDDMAYRSNAGMQCWTFMVRVWARRDKAGSARTKWNWMRYSAAVIPVVAAGAGGSLVGHVTGGPATVIGWVALIGGIVGAAVNAVRRGVEYSVGLKKGSSLRATLLGRVQLRYDCAPRCQA